VIEFTGERVIPGEVEADLWNEHFARYAFASQFAAGRTVLDIGCGSGYGAAELSRTARAVVGLDVSVEAAQYARAHFPAGNLHLTAASATALPYPASTFDLITSFEVIEHLHDWPQLIAEANRVLAAGGLFIVSTPNKACYATSRGPGGENPFHVHEFEAGEFEGALAQQFPYTQLLVENRSEALVIYPPKTCRPVNARADSSGGSASQAQYFVAVCSKQPIDPVPWFVWLPRVANVLAEREQHIEKLKHELALNQQWLAESRADHTKLLGEHEKQQAHLEEQNRWAIALETEWRATQQRVVDLQHEFAAAQKTARDAVAGLEAANLEKTEWALRLTAEVEHFRHQLTETVRLKEAAEATLSERTEWAIELQARLAHADALLAAVRASRWVRGGRLFGIGPKL